MNTINSIAEVYRQYMILSGFNTEMSKILISQAAHETNNFSSSVYKNNNNLFGMRLPVNRRTKAKGALNGYAYYQNYKDCIEDIKLYFDSFGMSYDYYSFEAYIKKIKENGYFEDSLNNYLTGVKHFYNLYYEG